MAVEWRKMKGRWSFTYLGRFEEEAGLTFWLVEVGSAQLCRYKAYWVIISLLKNQKAVKEYQISNWTKLPQLEKSVAMPEVPKSWCNTSGDQSCYVLGSHRMGFCRCRPPADPPRVRFWCLRQYICMGLDPPRTKHTRQTLETVAMVLVWSSNNCLLSWHLCFYIRWHFYHGQISKWCSWSLSIDVIGCLERHSVFENLYAG